MRRALVVAVLLALPIATARAEAPPKKIEAAPTAAAPAPAPAPVPRGEMAHAVIKGEGGQALGAAALEDSAHGVIITAQLHHLSPGMHAFHIHDTGKCEPPFKTAGGHFNPAGHKHGVRNPEGLHAGDLPNIEVGADGTARFQFFAAGATLKAGEKNSLFDADGAALVVHKGEDDLASDPAGNAGDRIGCGVVERSPTPARPSK